MQGIYLYFSIYCETIKVSIVKTIIQVNIAEKNISVVVKRIIYDD